MLFVGMRTAPGDRPASELMHSNPPGQILHTTNQNRLGVATHLRRILHGASHAR
jgi:hypothetical protein